MSSFSVDYAGGLPAFVFQPLTGVGVHRQTVKITISSAAPVYAGPAAALQTPNALPAGIPPNGHLYLQKCTAAVYVDRALQRGCGDCDDYRGCGDCGIDDHHVQHYGSVVVRCWDVVPSG